MKTVLQLFCVVVLGACLTACASSRSERIARDEARFNSYTPDERRLIRMGEVAVGFDQEQVRMTLGEPSREATVDAAQGKAVVWEYREIRPSIGLSAGGTLGTRGSGLGIGTGVGVNPARTELRQRITFDRQTGKVSRVETYE